MYLLGVECGQEVSGGDVPEVDHDTFIRNRVVVTRALIENNESWLECNLNPEDKAVFYLIGTGSTYFHVRVTLRKGGYDCDNTLHPERGKVRHHSINQLLTWLRTLNT